MFISQEAVLAEIHSQVCVTTAKQISDRFNAHFQRPVIQVQDDYCNSITPNKMRYSFKLRSTSEKQSINLPESGWKTRHRHWDVYDERCHRRLESSAKEQSSTNESRTCTDRRQSLTRQVADRGLPSRRPKTHTHSPYSDWLHCLHAVMFSLTEIQTDNKLFLH